MSLLARFTVRFPNRRLLAFSSMSELVFANLSWVNRALQGNAFSCCVLCREINSIFHLLLLSKHCKHKYCWGSQCPIYLGNTLPIKSKTEVGGRENSNSCISYLFCDLAKLPFHDIICVALCGHCLQLFILIQLTRLVSRICQLVWEKLRSGKWNVRLYQFKGAEN